MDKQVTLEQCERDYAARVDRWKKTHQPEAIQMIANLVLELAEDEDDAIILLRCAHSMVLETIDVRRYNKED